MTKLSEILQKTDRIIEIAETTGFKNIRIIKNPSEKSTHDFWLLVDIDRNNPNCDTTNESILVFKLQQKLNCIVNIALENELPWYMVEPVKKSAIPLNIKNFDQIYNFFGGDVDFSELELSDPEEIKVYKKEQEIFDKIYQDLEYKKDSSGSFRP